MADVEKADGGNTSLLDVIQVAKLLCCSTRHIYRMSDAGLMPRPFKLGALVRWSKASIHAWVESGCRPVRRAGGAQ